MDGIAGREQTAILARDGAITTAAIRKPVLF
ncbi:hypothetical protein HNQ50_002651 [Silvimonas terrae]|uniref:Uncharacterized protein n=1 Tax=Silvimonas terrae TaxID=300266 RepID=A0A840RH59_9NEIS|nr:hypothetical protein [Silvimonas terrae]